MCSVIRAQAVDSTRELVSGFACWRFASPYPHPFEMEADVHRCFEIGILLNGRQDRHVENLVTHLQVGDVYLNPAWEPHGWRATAPHTELLVIHFLPEFLGEETFDDISWLSPFVAPPRQRPRVTDSAMRQRVLAIAQSLSAEAEERGRRWLAGQRLGILQLLYTICRDWDPSRRTGERTRMRASNLARIVPAVDLVQAHPGRRVRLEEAAEACRLSVSQFLNLFRQTMGLSFGKFALRHRLAQGAHLLLSTELPTSAIAERLGFEDASHFHHAFAKLYGATPAEFRRDGLRTPRR
jgi:AraC-like DNA-binding protein